jgi:hypothetical protein
MRYIIEERAFGALAWKDVFAVVTASQRTIP